MGASQVPRVPCRKGTISPLGNSRCQVLLAGATRRRQVFRIVDKDSKGNTTNQAAPRVVAKSARQAQRLADLQGRGDGLLTLRL